MDVAGQAAWKGVPPSMIIAIDGPAGSGKSTVAKALAARLGYRYLDTGAMYRAVALRALQTGVTLDDDRAVAGIAETEPIEFAHEGGSTLPTRVLIGGQDVTAPIRTPEVDVAVSPVSALPSVRERMVHEQRMLAAGQNVVVEGRDIGTVVFPDAGLKVFLIASPEERARRRGAEQRAAGAAVTDSDVLAAIVRRDAYDSGRAHSPLVAAADAVVVDTTGLTIPEVVESVAVLAESRASRTGASEA
jgi:cytidylate kinase